jgi:hypothetical protein
MKEPKIQSFCKTFITQYSHFSIYMQYSRCIPEKHHLMESVVNEKPFLVMLPVIDTVTALKLQLFLH